MSTQHGLIRFAAVAVATMFVGACGVSDSTAPVLVPEGIALASHVALDPMSEQVMVCKLYDHGTPLGPGATFDWTIDDWNNGSIDFSGTVAVGPDQCVILPTMGTQTHDHLVVVKEKVPYGYYSTLRSVEYHAGVYTATDRGVAEMGTAYMHGDRGFTLAFTNHKRGANGCSYQYWRDDQHVDSWPAPYTPNTLYSAVFDDAFPGKTLGQVLGTNSSGLDALGREAVAALLNSQSGFYWFTSGEVKTMFNNVYPAMNTAYAKLQYRFEGLNLAGCPLN